jgi:hypothetical protein
MEFLSAAQLKKEFRVEASFYQIIVGNNMYQCRKHAVIIRKGYSMENHPDAVIVMANPGSCSPSDKSYEAPVVQGTIKNVKYVSVDDDQTQQQLMRLMKLMNWNFISIINLSDLCAGNMADFGKKLNEIESYHYVNHSIFAEDRKEEREEIFKCIDSKLILAWGGNSKIRKLACDTLAKLPKERFIFGLPGTKKWSYRHPFPMIQAKCKAWLKDMVEQLNDSDSKSQIAATKEGNK